ncbi:MAG: hypothetical protein K6G75_05995 [Lachnospiraceae bacterium]|nr:hypothetical protein [Lachnospiraceae bacterium]
MKENLKAILMLSAIVIIVPLSVVVLIFDAVENFKESRCEVRGCYKRAVDGKIYCSEHLENLFYTLYGSDNSDSSSYSSYRDSYQPKTSGNNSYSSGNNSSSNNNYSKKESNTSSYSHKTYDDYREYERDLSFDPDDYDDPDEYADDAWDEDFDDYDEAYDFWEDY